MRKSDTYISNISLVRGISKSSDLAVFEIFFLGYVFLSGFVFIEPSPAELWFLVFALFLLRKIRLDSEILLTLWLLMGPMVISAYIGQVFFGLINLRFLVIDFYLFLLFILVTSFLRYYFESKFFETLVHKTFVIWAFAGAVNVLASLFSISASGRLLGVELLVFGIRMKGFFKDPNVLGPFLVPPAVYFLNVLNDGKAHKKYSFLYFLGFLLLSLGVLFTFSRAAWLNYGISLGLFFIIKLFRGPVHRTLKLIVFVFLVFALAANLADSVTVWDINLAQFIQNRSRLQGYDQDRFATQFEVFEILENSNVFFGAGPGNYEFFTRMATHSLYARYLGERGVFGFLLFLFFFMLVFWRLMSLKCLRFLLPVMIGQVVNSLFIDSLHWRHLWVLISLCFV